MDSLRNLLAHKSKKVEYLQRESNETRKLISDYIETSLNFPPEILADVYMDGERLVITVTHKAYASIINAHVDRILQRIRQNNIFVSSITIL